MLTTRVKTGGLLLLALLLSALAFYFLGDDGFFAAQFSSEETGAMFLEIGVLFLLLFVAARRVKSCQRGIANALICVFLRRVTLRSSAYSLRDFGSRRLPSSGGSCSAIANA